MKYNLFSWTEDQQSLVLRAGHAMWTESTLPQDLSRAGVSSSPVIAAKSLLIPLAHEQEEQRMLVSLGHSYTHTRSGCTLKQLGYIQKQKHSDKFLDRACCSLEDVEEESPFSEVLFPQSQ